MSPLDVFGAAPVGQRLERMRASPNFSDGRARNLEATPMGASMKMFSAMGDYVSGGQTPDVELPVMEPSFGSPSDALQATWLGHSSTLLDVDGVRLLTDPFDAANLIRERFGGFDLTMIECGAHHPAWGSIHLGPLEAEKLHRMVGGGILMPVHWGTFSLAPHRWDAPIVELLQHAARGGTRLVAPAAGQTLDPRQPFVHDFWLERAAQAVPGKTPAWETS